MSKEDMQAALMQNHIEVSTVLGSQFIIVLVHNTRD